MKKTSSFLLSILIAGAVVAQSSKIDSLKNLLKTEKKDTSRAKISLSIASAYGEISSDSTLSYLFEAIKLADKTGYYPLQIRARYGAGYIMGYTGNYVKALQMLLQAKTLAQKKNDTAAIRGYYFNLGHLYKRQQDYRKAADNYLLSIEKDGSSTGVPEMNLGQVYMELGQPDSALFYNTRAYETLHRLKNTIYIGGVLATMARAYEKRGELLLARTYLSMAEEIMLLQSKQNKQHTCLEISKFFASAGKKDSSIFYAKKALRIQGGELFKPNLFDAASMLSKLYEGQNADSAYQFLKMSVTLNQEMLSSEKSQQLQTLRFEDELEQQKEAQERQQNAQERKHNLQYAAIALGLVTFFVFFLLFSHSVIANQRLIKFLGILALLIVFEFINLFIHPYLDKLTNHSIPLMLGIMVCIAALLIPLHHKLEHWITHKLVEKNKKIRLAAAKKTIEQLERSTDAQQQL
jgi:tetratricopeptide (TPR) repeat protein